MTLLDAGVDGHRSCDLVLGRFSYPLIEVCEAGDWLDAGWLRLLLLAGPDAARTARLRGWTFERASRLRAELLDEEPGAAQQAAREDLSVKAVFEKLNALPARDRAGARWVMSMSTLESLCGLNGRPKPIPGAQVELIGLPVDLDETAHGVELRARRPAVAEWPPGNVTPAP